MFEGLFVREPTEEERTAFNGIRREILERENLEYPLVFEQVKPFNFFELLKYMHDKLYFTYVTKLHYKAGKSGKGVKINRYSPVPILDLDYYARFLTHSLFGEGNRAGVSFENMSDGRPVEDIRFKPVIFGQLEFNVTRIWLRKGGLDALGIPHDGLDEYDNGQKLFAVAQR